MIIAILAIVIVCVVAIFIADDIRTTRAQKSYGSAQMDATDRLWQGYREWCDSRVCIGGCGKKAKYRPRDANGVCTEIWITEECCWDCWKAGRSTGRSAESQEWANQFLSSRPTAV